MNGGRDDADVTGRDPLVMSLVEDVAHVDETNGADAAIDVVAAAVASDVDDDDDVDDGD